MVKHYYMWLCAFYLIRILCMCVCAENMWGDYMEKGQILEKASLSSVDVHGSMETFGFYVSADIATSFTLLVGIFFPSATGKTHLSSLVNKYIYLLHSFLEYFILIGHS